MEDRLTDSKRLNNSLKVSYGTIRTRLKYVVGSLGEHDYLPTHPNWLARLQDLLEDAGIDPEQFVATSVRGHEGHWPSFALIRHRLHIVSYGVERRATVETLLDLIKKTNEEPLLL